MTAFRRHLAILEILVALRIAALADVWADRAMARLRKFSARVPGGSRD